MNYKCELCDRMLASKTRAAGCTEWDWFTGSLSRTVHFCPEHKNSEQAKQLLKASKVKPTTSEEA